MMYALTSHSWLFAMSSKLVMFTLLICMHGVAAGQGHLYEENRDNRRATVEVHQEDKSGYSISIRRNDGLTAHIPSQMSVPPPRLAWISSDLLQIDYGSKVGADIRSTFYSMKRAEIAGPYEFVKTVDAENELVLVTSDRVYVKRLYKNSAVFVVPIDYLSTADLKWFVVSSESKFTRHSLLIDYMNKTSDNGDDEMWVSKEIPLPASLYQ